MLLKISADQAERLNQAVVRLYHEYLGRSHGIVHPGDIIIHLADQSSPSPITTPFHPSQFPPNDGSQESNIIFDTIIIPFGIDTNILEEDVIALVQRLEGRVVDIIPNLSGVDVVPGHGSSEKVLLAIWELEGLRAREWVRDSYGNGKCSQFIKLVEVIPPGGSLGLDDKLFCIPNAYPNNETKFQELYRFENAELVEEYRDPRVNARLLIEAQFYNIRFIIEAFQREISSPSPVVRSQLGKIPSSPLGKRQRIHERLFISGNLGQSSIINVIAANVLGRDVFNLPTTCSLNSPIFNAGENEPCTSFLSATPLCDNQQSTPPLSPESTPLARFSSLHLSHTQKDKEMPLPPVTSSFSRHTEPLTPPASPHNSRDEICLNHTKASDTILHDSSRKGGVTPLNLTFTPINQEMSKHPPTPPDSKPPSRKTSVALLPSQITDDLFSSSLVEDREVSIGRKTGILEKPPSIEQNGGTKRCRVRFQDISSDKPKNHIQASLQSRAATFSVSLYPHLNFRTSAELVPVSRCDKWSIEMYAGLRMEYDRLRRSFQSYQ